MYTHVALCLDSLLILDKDWTKEETDYLFGVAKDYDCRWYVVHDRYDYPGGPQRSLEVGNSINPRDSSAYLLPIGCQRPFLQCVPKTDTQSALGRR